MRNKKVQKGNVTALISTQGTAHLSSCTGLCGNYTPLCPDSGVEQHCHLVWYFMLHPSNHSSSHLECQIPKIRAILQAFPTEKEVTGSSGPSWPWIFSWTHDSRWARTTVLNFKCEVWRGLDRVVHYIQLQSLVGTVGIQNSVVYFYSPLSS